MLGRARHDCEAYTAALTAAAVGLDRNPRVEREMALLAALSVAHHDLVVHMEATFVTLGLPYEAVIEADYEEEEEPDVG